MNAILNFQPAQNLNLNGLIEYSPSSIVSRTLFKSENNNLTLFAFDQGQDLTEHISTFNAFVYLVEGAMELKIGGNPVSLTAGEIALMPANVPHALKAVEKCKMLLIMMK